MKGKASPTMRERPYFQRATKRLTVDILEPQVCREHFICAAYINISQSFLSKCRRKLCREKCELTVDRN
jgi:hypothetical protein